MKCIVWDSWGFCTNGIGPAVRKARQLRGTWQGVALHDVAWHGLAWHGTAQYSMTQHNISQHSIAQHSIAQHSTTQHIRAEHVVSWLALVHSELVPANWKQSAGFCWQLWSESSVQCKFRGTCELKPFASLCLALMNWSSFKTFLAPVN